MKRFLPLLLTLLLLFACAPPTMAQLFGWRFDEFQPDVANGGRVNSIAVHPRNDNVLLVASESGGLFRSTDRGAHWRHVDSLPVFSTNSVAYVPADPRIVILTTGEDFRTANGGGIWRSTDGGGSWRQITPGPPQPAGVRDRLTAWDISIAPDSGTIYVSHNWGLSISADRGAHWTHVDPFGAIDHRVVSVVAQRGNRVIAGGPAGIRHSPDGGGTWLPATTSPGGIWDLHALAGSPFASGTAYAVDGNTSLFFTDDGGDHWTQIASAPGGGGGCGGIAFVKAAGRKVYRPFRIERRLTLWFGNRCGLSTLDATPVPHTSRFTYGGTWTNRNMDHGDTRHLAFTKPRRFTGRRSPLLLGTDGGLHNTRDSGMNWTFTGGGRNGFNALQITEVKGQWISDVGRHDLYFATQDNDVLASGDGGATWPARVCCEGFFIEREHRVATAADSKVTFVACGPCGDFITNPLLAGLAGWPDITSPPAGNPKILGANVYAQGVETGGSFTKGIGLTTNLGGSWNQYANIAEDRRDLPRLAVPGALRPVLYQSVRTGWYGPGDFEVNTLVRVVKRLFGSGATVGYPANNNFGGLGINPTMFAWYQVFGVDSGDSRHVIAPDVVNEKMMETRDGGNNWSEIPGLTSMITDGGRFLFRRWIFPFASAVSFSPDDPNMVAVGTWQNGVFVSGDRGATWTKVPDSERATYITSVEWKSPGEAIVSSYGRGLWRMNFQRLLSIPDLHLYCRRPFCFVNPLDDPPLRFDQAVLVFQGDIRGARIENGVLQELFVSPGSSVVFFSDTKKDAGVKITETLRQRGFGAVQALQTGKRDTHLVGLTMDYGKASPIYASQLLSFREPDRKNEEIDVAMSEESPTKGKPYIELNPSKGGNNAVGPGEPLELTLRNLPPGTTVVLTIDDKPVRRMRVNDVGVVSFRVTAPREFGLHSLTIRDESGRVIDGAMFLVRHADEPMEKQRVRQYSAAAAGGD